MANFTNFRDIFAIDLDATKSVLSSRATAILTGATADQSLLASGQSTFARDGRSSESPGTKPGGGSKWSFGHVTSLFGRVIMAIALLVTIVIGYLL